MGLPDGPKSFKIDLVVLIQYLYMLRVEPKNSAIANKPRDAFVQTQKHG